MKVMFGDASVQVSVMWNGTDYLCDMQVAPIHSLEVLEKIPEKIDDSISQCRVDR